MAKVIMDGFTVHNVVPCPKCGATEYARIDRIMNMVVICCDKCDYEAPGAVLVPRRKYSLKENRKDFIELVRFFFNHWNKAIADEKGEKPKRVRIINAVREE